MPEFMRQQNRGRSSYLVSAKAQMVSPRLTHVQNSLLAQQQPLGNQATQRFAESCPLALPSPTLCPFGGVCHTCPVRVQAKLTVNNPGDKYEQEADRAAEQVMRMPEPLAPESRAIPHQPKGIRIQRLGSECDVKLRRQPKEEEEEGEIPQAKETQAQMFEVTPDVQNQINAVRGAGKPLPVSVRSFFEPRFGYDFSPVQVHMDAPAGKLTKAMRAQAFTLGRDIVFSAGKYTPETAEGRRLLAHELTHVVQQAHGEKRIGRQAEPPADTDAQPPTLATPANPQIAQDAGVCNPVVTGFPPTFANCSLYLANSWWLPMAYANNAMCACMTTPNSQTANCVRKFLQDRLTATPRWVKAAAAAQKPLEMNPLTYPSYQVFVQSVLTPRIYQDHVDAYRNCCCRSGPAPYLSWVGVTTVPIQPCSLVGEAIEHFGSCHGTPGRW
jgi:hypothetical protein